MANYTTDAKVQARLANAGLGVSGNTMYNDSQLSEALTEIDAMINVEIGATSNVTTEPWATLFGKIEVDIVAMMILQGRHFRENNLVSDVGTYWGITPTFTNDHRRIFGIYLERSAGTRNYSTSTGQEVK